MLATAGLLYQDDRLEHATAGDPDGQLVASRSPLGPGDRQGPQSAPNRFIHVTVATTAEPTAVIGIHAPVLDPDASAFFEARCGIAGKIGRRRGSIAGDVNADARYPGL